MGTIATKTSRSNPLMPAQISKPAKIRNITKLIFLNKDNLSLLFWAIVEKVVPSCHCACNWRFHFKKSLRSPVSVCSGSHSGRNVPNSIRFFWGNPCVLMRMVLFRINLPFCQNRMHVSDFCRFQMVLGVCFSVGVFQDQLIEKLTYYESSAI